MKTINIYKAQPVVKGEEVESLTINLHKPLPEKVYKDLDEWRQVAKKEAATLCESLCGALPQGVTDALLVELLDRKRSLFVVPMESAAPQPINIKTRPAHVKCLVKGCENHSDQGQFVGDLCLPCHDAITSGVVGRGNGFIGVLYRDNRDLVQDISKCGQIVEQALYLFIKLRCAADSQYSADLANAGIKLCGEQPPAPPEPGRTGFIVEAVEHLRTKELESSLQSRYFGLAGLAQVHGLHVMPFEEWLVKRAIDGDSEADELLGLRQER